MANRQEPEFISELTGAEKCLAKVAVVGDLNREARIINILIFFGLDESPLQELSIVDGASIWAGGDGIHLTSNAIASRS